MVLSIIVSVMSAGLHLNYLMSEITVYNEYLYTNWLEGHFVNYNTDL